MGEAERLGVMGAAARGRRGALLFRTVRKWSKEDE